MYARGLMSVRHGALKRTLTETVCALRHSRESGSPLDSPHAVVAGMNPHFRGGDGEVKTFLC